ncbi:unnamed protein product [Diatraea saccharalis]|uniref:ATP-dependent DNA helicase n=1 Tax=Diatraea saccharalis TaxID=40085 RepID=A0A9N9W7G5_9NEOP|nr:unnamed protein product [Diatraea saccharalis]
MSHKRAVEALNRSLLDIRSNETLMGGAVVVLTGDFRQTLPVIEKGTPADEMNACLKASSLWSHVEKLHFTRNMRAQLYNDTESVATEEELLANVFPDLKNKINNEEWLFERAVLSPKNELVNKINNKVLDVVDGASRVYTSIDTVMASDDSTAYPVEFLNSLELTGVPPHKLELKVGVPVLLMRNLDAPRLCNGTRLQISELGRNIVRATILTGAAKGESVLIPPPPRILIIPHNFPFQFKRLQFPLKLAFAMTINKSQGQTLKVAGMHLGIPCFTHGQLYVACSRVSSARNLVSSPKPKTMSLPILRPADRVSSPKPKAMSLPILTPAYRVSNLKPKAMMKRNKCNKIRQ